MSTTPSLPFDFRRLTLSVSGLACRVFDPLSKALTAKTDRHYAADFVHCFLGREIAQLIEGCFYLAANFVLRKSIVQLRRRGIANGLNPHLKKGASPRL